MFQLEITVDYLSDQLDKRIPAEHVHIVETGHENTADHLRWFRLYSDGWLEQGGIRRKMDTSTDYACEFMRAFSDTGYTFVATPSRRDKTQPHTPADLYSVDCTSPRYAMVYTWAYPGQDNCPTPPQWRACGYA